LTRSLRTRKFPIWSVILITQLATMILIGLWHGVTLNFVIWGIWQGLGLFVHNRWSDATRARVGEWASTPLRQNLLNASGIFITFNFVAISLVWFVLPTPSLALQYFGRLFGM
jgi:D-alanyl-lipoteichoic acid acyltransferase DltB (MBOAT superfamily)